MTRSSWSNTALCFARYLSFSCFFFLPKMEQLICSFFDFSIAWQAILHSYVADVLITLMQQIFLWWESFLSNYWALWAGSIFSSYLELRTGNEARSPSSSHLPGLPPVVIILADNLQDVPGVEGDAGLGAGDQVIIHWVILKLGPDKDVTRGWGWPVRGNNLEWGTIVTIQCLILLCSPWRWRFLWPPSAASAGSQWTGWPHLSH